MYDFEDKIYFGDLPRFVRPHCLKIHVFLCIVSTIERRGEIKEDVKQKMYNLIESVLLAGGAVNKTRREQQLIGLPPLCTHHGALLGS